MVATMKKTTVPINLTARHIVRLAVVLSAGIVTGTSLAEAPAPYIAPSIKPELILQGVVKHVSFSQSAIFPGTVRNVAVFIPAQYDGSKPACVYVKTDGYNPVEKSLLETLIATKEMPVTIGVFVTPGDLPATVKNTLGRRNRCFEYDGMGDNNARFFWWRRFCLSWRSSMT
jgi:gluconolactonase